MKLNQSLTLKVFLHIFSSHQQPLHTKLLVVVVVLPVEVNHLVDHVKDHVVDSTVAVCNRPVISKSRGFSVVVDTVDHVVDIVDHVMGSTIEVVDTVGSKS